MFLIITKYHAMKMYPILYQAPRHKGIYGSGGIDSCSGRFISEVKIIGTHWIGIWMGAGAGMNAISKRKIPCAYRKSNSGRPT
jgi:hypothetical protein